MSNMITNASDSDISRRDAEQVEEATAVLEMFADPETLFPRWEGLPLRDQARRLDLNGANPFKWTKDQQRKLSHLLFDQFVQDAGGEWTVLPNKYKLGAVQLYTGDRGGRPSFFPIPGVPVIVFTTLDTRSPRYVAGECEALAVVYMTTETREREDRKTGITWEVMDDRRFDGIIGVLKYYDTAEAADEARVELQRAVNALSRSVSGTAERTDPVRYAVSDVTVEPDVF